MRFGCLGQAFLFVVQMVAAGATVAYLRNLIPLPEGQRVSFFVILGLLFIAILLHELGHMIAGLLTDHRVVRVQVGPFFFEDDPQKDAPRVGFKPLLGTGMGGFVLMLPRDFADLRLRTLITILGGPAASVGSGTLGLVAFALMFGGDFTPVTMHTVGLFSMLSILLGMINLIPVRTPTFQTDGGQVVPLVVGGKHAQYQVARRSLTTLEALGTRARDLPPGLIKRMLVLQNKSQNHIEGLMMAYRHFEDANRFEQAGKFLAQAVTLAKRHPKRAMQGVYGEAAYFWAFYYRKPELAKSFYRKVKKRRLPPASKYIYSAAIALAEGDHHTATEMAHLALGEIDKMPTTAQLASVRKTAHDILEAAITEGRAS
jgi:hypothetical protein